MELVVSLSNILFLFRFWFQKTFDRRSERVKSIYLHPTESWVLIGTHLGNVCIWNHRTQVSEKTFEIANSRVRSAKFIARKEWVIIGADDGFIRVYNYNTMENITEFKAHSDFIRSLVLWDLGSLEPRSSVNGHTEGLNSVKFYETGEKLYILTGSDDHTAKVWDYESMTCVKTLEGHTHNVTSFQCVKLDASFIITGSEDQTVRVWNTQTYNLDYIFTSDLGRVWTIGFIEGSSEVVLGCDEGILIGQVSSAGC
ncbi:hypothetical protein L1987_47896 [Smallanthus sonchifolius]|uniref:Uncharacterized protein n=1 Tax=Smallanthus sonchifolius TaxID=185202 RepID=A0ACB9FQ33_9ASTR|nr:hypothetical protein L1987_47896 [Smallanthus sonchifolius]